MQNSLEFIEIFVMLVLMAEVAQSIFRERPYEIEDLGDLERVEKGAGEACWDRAAIAFNAKQLNRETRVLMAEGEEDLDELIGFYVVEFEENHLYLCNLAISPQWRRRGAAQFALQAIESMAAELNYPEIALDVQENNLPAQLLYKKCGFTAVEIRRRHYETQDGYHMTKDLV